MSKEMEQMLSDIKERIRARFDGAVDIWISSDHAGVTFLVNQYYFHVSWCSYNMGKFVLEKCTGYRSNAPQSKTFMEVIQA